MDAFLPDIPRVAVLLPTAIKTCREMLQGILRYSQLHGPWALQIIEGREGEQKLFRFREWGCTGIIGNLNDRFFARFATDLSIPVILTNPTNTFHPGRSPDAPVRMRSVVGVVSCDNGPIGTAAARYFLARGRRHFAFVGEVNGAAWSEERRQAFADALKAAGHTCAVYAVPSAQLRRDAARERRCLAAWIAALPKPIALFASNDIRGRQVLDACRDAGVGVPQDVSVLSCDNDELYCETSVPQLSSIQMNPEQAGFEAAAFLDRIMRGTARRPRTPHGITYTITDIVTRYSSETASCSDPVVERALAHIRQHAGPALTVTGLARRIGVSRRLLELRFRNVLGRTVHAEILHARLERAKKLLLTTSTSVEQIAAACGFASSSHLGSVFRRQVGTTPSAFRRSGSKSR